MVDVLAGSGLGFPAASQPTILAGYVSRSQKPPTSFDEPVRVVVPNHSTEVTYGPVRWPKIHGEAMPQGGTPMWLAIDDNRAPLVVWWEATYDDSFPVDGPASVPSLRTLGPGAQQAAGGTDPRLTDQRVPADGSVTATKIAASLKPSGSAATTAEALRALGTAAGNAAAGNDARFTPDQAAGTGSPRTLGTGALQGCAGNDSRLSDQRTPTTGSVTTAKIVAAAVGPTQLDRPYLQLGPGASLGAAFGAGSFVGNGTAAMSLTIGHGFGSVPQVIFVSPFFDGTLAMAAVPDLTHYYLLARRLDGGTFTNAATFVFYFMLVG